MDKLRNQRLTLIIAVPEGGKVTLQGKTIFPTPTESKTEIHGQGFLNRAGEYTAW
jgi:hypothetical protein